MGRMIGVNNCNQTQPIIIGIDSGYGNTKTAHFCFPTAVTAHDREPIFRMNLLVYNGRYYTIGEGHKEFIAEKAVDQDHYVLMLAGVAQELRYRNLTNARVYLAAGLPLTWVSVQKDSYRAYLLQNDTVDFNYRGVDYHVEFVGTDIYPQGFSAVADKLREFQGVNMLCDIGNGTMNMMYINNRRPVAEKCFTEKYGTHQCMLAARERLMQRCHADVDDSVIEQVFHRSEADIAEFYLAAICKSAAEYVDGIMRRLREHGTIPARCSSMSWAAGAALSGTLGGTIPSVSPSTSDIHATAKGYETLAANKLHSGRSGVV